MRGRKPTPTRLKLLRGNPGKRPLNDKEPRPDGAPVCPDWLDGEAQREWDRVVPRLVRLGLATELDQALLAAYCAGWSQWRRATEVVAREGATYTTGGGLVRRRPEVAIAQEAGRQLERLAARFGFSPADRARLAVEPPRGPDPLDALLGAADPAERFFSS
jgi:P27 family predicted phage terminase small subunit